MGKILLGFTAALVLASAPAHAAGECEELCQAEFYQTATADMVQLLLDQGADVNAKDAAGKTPLHWAAKADLDTVRTLMSAGAEVNAKDDLDRTPLHFLSASAAPDIVILLVKAGADVNAKTANDWTPLHGVAKFGTPENIKILLGAGADASLVNEMGETPFDLAATNEGVKASPEYQILKAAAGH